jgi:DNA-binding response OmpR family regulator
VDPSVLIVDDEHHIRLLIEQALESLEDQGVTLLTAADGEEALTIIKEERPQLILLDVMMPKMNGFDVCRVVKQELGLQGTYVMLLTAKGQEFDRQRGADVGADMYLTKPFDPDELLQHASDVLGL